jgi:predicted GNAT family acetyltransferase
MTEAAVVHNEELSRFEMQADGSTAVLRYQRNGDTLIITGTLVPRPLEGRGIGSALVREALEFSRQNELTVAPLCSFAAAWIARHPEYADLVKLRQH